MLLDLPTELLLAVLERVDQRTLLVSVPMVCRRLHAVLPDVPIPDLWLGAIASNSDVGRMLCRLRRVGTVHVPRHSVASVIREPWWLDGTPLGESASAIDFGWRLVDRDLLTKLGKRALNGIGYNEWDVEVVHVVRGTRVWERVRVWEPEPSIEDHVWAEREAKRRKKQQERARRSAQRGERRAAQRAARQADHQRVKHRRH